MFKGMAVVGVTLATMSYGCAASVQAETPMRWSVKTLTAPVGRAVVYTPLDQKKYPAFGITVSSRPQGGMTMALFESRSKQAMPSMFPGFRKVSDELITSASGFQVSDIQGVFSPSATLTMRVHQLFFINRGTTYLVSAYYPASRHAEDERIFQDALKRLQIGKAS